MSKEHLKTIRKVKEYIFNKDYETLEYYICRRENEIKKSDEDKASKYLDKLIEELK